ncbi:MAG: ferritin family protein [Candidatus Cloacimonadaceae bacterium]
MTDLKAAYELAIQNEIKSQNLYKLLARSFAGNPDIAQTFSRLVPMEALHEEKLHTLVQQKFPQAVLKLDPTLHHTLPAEELKDADKVLEFAISREELARDNYLQLAADTPEPELQALFTDFAAEESNHKTILQTEILRLDGLMTWFDSSELNGMMED